MQQLTVPSKLDLSPSGLIPAMVARRAEEHPNGVCFERFVGGDWLPITAGAIHRRAHAKAHGLIASGVEPGDRVVIMSDNRYEYMLLELAIWMAGAVSVPVYVDFADHELDTVLVGCKPVMAMVETEEMADRLEAISADPDLQLYVLESGDLDDLISAGAARMFDDEPLAELDADTPATVSFTAGTADDPKPCVLTHGNCAAFAQALADHPVSAASQRGRRALMFMTLAHIQSRLVSYAFVAAETAVGFWPLEADLMQGLATYRPHVLLGVPFVFERALVNARAAAYKGGWAQRRVFDVAHRAAVTVSRAWGNDAVAGAGNITASLRARHAVSEKTVYRYFRQIFGGRCELILCGDGPVLDELLHFYRGAGLPIYEGYGLTEALLISLNGPGWLWVGSAGRPTEGYSVRIDDDGEILAKGPGVFAGYLDEPERTAAAFTADGYLRTGDLGQLSNEGYLKVFGRKSSLITLAGGEQVLPEPVEREIKRDTMVSQVLLVGEGRSQPGALLTVRPRAALRWAADHGIDVNSVEQLVETEEFRDRVREAIDRGNALLSADERVRIFTILPNTFSHATGELTVTYKLRRKAVAELYARHIERMFDVKERYPA